MRVAKAEFWRGGFTLVEVVLAFGIVAFVLISLLGLSTSLSKQVSDAKNDTLVVCMTQEAITRVRAVPWDQLSSSNFYFDGDGMTCDATKAFYQVRLEPSNTYPPEWPTNATSLKVMKVTLKSLLGGTNAPTLSFPVGVAQYE